MSAQDWESYSIQVAIKIEKEEFVLNYLKFDAECFFRVIQYLFKGKAYSYLVKSHETDQTPLCATPEKLIAGLARMVEKIP